MYEQRTIAKMFIRSAIGVLDGRPVKEFLDIIEELFDEVYGIDEDSTDDFVFRVDLSAEQPGDE
jgi:hypothetical protein